MGKRLSQGSVAARSRGGLGVGADDKQIYLLMQGIERRSESCSRFPLAPQTK